MPIIITPDRDLDRFDTWDELLESLTQQPIVLTDRDGDHYILFSDRAGRKNGGVLVRILDNREALAGQFTLADDSNRPGIVFPVRKCADTITFANKS